MFDIGTPELMQYLIVIPICKQVQTQTKEKSFQFYMIYSQEKYDAQERSPF